MVRRSDKTLGPLRDRPRAYVTFPLLLELENVLESTVEELEAACSPEELLFPIAFGTAPGSASSALTAAFQRIFGDVVTSHCARVGCATTLLNCGMAPELVRAHIDWAESSATWRVYHRPGWPVQPFDVAFFYGALPVSLQVSLEAFALQSLADG